MNRILSICMGLLMLCIFAPAVSAQGGYEVKGVVSDEAGPVIGATVIEQGTTTGTATGLDGDFVLTVSSADAVVEISCIGYKTISFKAGEVPAEIKLLTDVEFLEDVVVIGYGTVRKEDMTGSITAIKTDDINRGAITSTQDLLKGKVPGLYVIPGDGGPGSGSTIRIRGAASLNASNDPLYVIDGVPIAVDGGAGMANPLETINPNDIESFSVLKDASSAAIYGSRASNGVIIITTKKGRGNKPQVSYKEGIRRAASADAKYVRQTGGHGMYGHAKITIEPNEGGKGYEFIDEVVGGEVPKEYIPAIDKGIRSAMQSGILAGYNVVDVKVTLTGGSYHEVDSNEMAFSIAGSMAFKEAMAKADPVLTEPIMKVVVSMPEEYMGDVMGNIIARRGNIQSMEDDNGMKVIHATVPLSEMFGYATDLRSRTQGRGIYTMEPSHYEEVPKSVQEAIIKSRAKN